MLPVSSGDDVDSGAIDQNQQQLMNGAQLAKSKGNFSIAAIMGHVPVREPQTFEGQCSPPLSPESNNFKPSVCSGK